MLKPNDEGRGVEALQEAESRQFVPLAADEAFGVDLLDSPRAEDRFAGQRPTALERPVVEEPAEQPEHDTKDHPPHAQGESSGARRERRRPALLLGSAIFALAVASSGYLYWDDARHFEETDDAFVASRQVPIAPKISGYVTAIPVTDNQHVAAGDVIARIDDRDYRVALDQANAQVAAARASIENIDAQTAVQRAQVEANQA